MGQCRSSIEIARGPRSTPADSQVRVLLTGIDAAGKTCFINRGLYFSPKLSLPTIPTVGFNVETFSTYPTKLDPKDFTIDDILNQDAAPKRYFAENICVWEAGGVGKIRPLWSHYFNNQDALIYMVDASDRSRIEEAKIALEKEILKHPRAVAWDVVVVVANKQDRVADGLDIMSVDEIKSLMNLEKNLENVTYWTVLGTSTRNNSPSVARMNQLLEERQTMRKAEGKNINEIRTELKDIESKFDNMKVWGSGMEEVLEWVLDNIANHRAAPKKKAAKRLTATPTQQKQKADPTTLSIEVSDDNVTAATRPTSTTKK